MTKNKNTEPQLKPTVKELQVLYQIAKVMSSRLGLQELLKLVLRKALDVTGADCGTLSVMDEEGRGLVHKVLVPEDVLALPQKIGEGVTGRAAEKKRAILVPDVRENADYIRAFPSTKSELAVPMTDGNKLIGVLNLESSEINGFDGDDQRLVESLASWAVVGMRNAKMFDNVNEESSRRVKELEILQKTAELISSTLDLKQVLKLVVERGLGLIRTLHRNTEIHGAIRLKEKTTGKLYIAEASANFPKGEKRRKLKIGEEGITGWVAEARNALIVNDVRREPWRKWYVPSIPTTKSELAVPLLLDEKLIGIFDLQSPRVGVFDEDDKRLITSLAGQVVVALRNAEQYQALLGIYDVAKIIGASSSTEQILQLVLNRGVEKTGAHSASARLLDRTKKYLDPVARCGEEVDRSWTPITIGEGVVGAAAKERTTIRVPNVDKDKRYLGFNPATKSELAVPMLNSRNKLVGIVNFEHPRLDVFDQDDEKFIESLVDLAVIAIERLEKDQELRKANEQLEAASAMFWLTMVKGSWLHEVNQKSHTIRVKVDTVKNNPSITREDLVKNLDAIDDLARVIATAAPELPSREVEEAVYVDEVLHFVIEECCRRHTNVKVDFRGPSVELPIIVASNAWLALAFKNVVNNSLRAMTTGGTLKIACNKGGSRINVIIKDTGCGIPEEIQKRLFREPASGTGESGMGLLITRSIMLKYGGNVALENTGPQGTTFRLWLPVEQSRERKT